MINRVTENMKYNTITNNLFNVQGQSAELMEKLSTQKMVNRPSDNPIGTNNVLNYRSVLASIEQYQANIKTANTWLSLTDTNLSGIKGIVDKAIDIAISQSSSVAAPETMTANAAVLDSLIDDVLSMANAKIGDNYLFGGSKTDIMPFSTTLLAATINPASAATANIFNGTVTSGGTYTGTENKTYAVKIIEGGTLAGATYQISSDGGKSWGTTQNFSPQEVIGDEENTEAGNPITAATVWDTIDGANVQDNDTVTITGKRHDGTAVNGTYTITDASSGTVQDLLDQIETEFGGTVTASIDADGKITVTDNLSGTSQMEIALAENNEGGGTLNFGAFAATTERIVSLGDGITMTFNASTIDFANNDLFSVNANTAGYYRGNDDNLTLQAGKGNNFIYNITGSDAFTNAKGPVAAASIGALSNLTANDTITLTRGVTAGTWTLAHTNDDIATGYPNMQIVSMNATAVTISVDGNAANNITVNLSGTWQANNVAGFSVTAGAPPSLSAVEVNGPGTVDLMTTLNRLKNALEDGDIDVIAAQIADLKIAQTQILTAQTQAGEKMRSLGLTSQNHTAFNEQIISMKSDIEDADLEKIIMQFQMQQIAMQSSYNLASQIGKMTILDYI